MILRLITGSQNESKACSYCLLTITKARPYYALKGKKKQKKAEQEPKGLAPVIRLARGLIDSSLPYHVPFTHVRIAHRSALRNLLALYAICTIVKP